jgi:hypothetical protein
MCRLFNMMLYTLLIISLPTECASARMRVWRALKAVGAVVLRDGVYLLPDGDSHRTALTTIAQDVLASGGAAYVLDARGEDYTGLFDRTADYQQLAADIDALSREVDTLAMANLSRQARKIRKAFDSIVAIDFFPGPAQTQTAALLQTLDEAIQNRLSPGEPSARDMTVKRLDAAEYQGQVWATRQRPWVDRLASAWLIRRFIDHKARFCWLVKPADCPEHAIGFDFDDARFSHVGERVTFETLLASFGLEADSGLARLAGVVHYLDVGGLPVPEASGLEALLAGMRASLADDDSLLETACIAFDYLYASFKDAP